MIKASKKALVYLAPALLALGLTACGSSSSSDSAVKVTNGILVKDTVFPSAVLLVTVSAHGESICTGTFVNDSQVVTAGHCVEGLSKTNPQMYFVSEVNGRRQAIAKAVTYVRNPDYSFAQGVGPNDISVVNFPANTAPAVSPLADVTPAIGAQFVIVGYGNNENFVSNGTLGGQGAGVKRAGTNIISSNEGGMLAFVGVTGMEEAPIQGEKEGQLVSSGSGDSGGPLFVDGKLAGVTSGGGLVQTQDGTNLAISQYVDLNSVASRAFLSGVIKPSPEVSPAPATAVAANATAG